MSRMELCAIYAHAKPEPVRPVKATRVIRRATGESAFKPVAKPVAKPVKRFNGTARGSAEAYARALCGLLDLT